MNPDALRESDSARDGFLSYAAEWHALSLGFGDGLALVAPSERLTTALESDTAEREIRKEPHYYTGGKAAGILVGILVYALSGGIGISLL